ncbi:MAG TPA: polysaccharide biosynthesis/export family protein [Moraxellaceae bacterium]
MLCVVLSPVAQAEPGWFDKLFGAPAASSPGVVVEPLAESSAAGGLVPPASLSLPEQGTAPVFSLASDYKLGPGDRVMVTVFNEKDLTVETRLSDAGTLSLPLLGEIRAQGMTIGMLQDYLTEQLKSGFLVNPQVYVSILEYRQFFVNGEVNKPGGLPFQPGLTVRKAIALAGGFTARASYTKIFVIHEDDPFGRPRAVSLDTFLRPGDILTIEQSFF